METVYYNAEPEAVQYMLLPNGEADVWLRKNIIEVESDDEWAWMADETYVHTNLTQEEVALNFDELFDGTYDPDADTSLEGIRAAKIAEMSAACNATIISGVDVTLSDGGTYHFSLTEYDQLTLNSLSKMLISGDELIPYHADGAECCFYSAEDFTAIITAATTHGITQQTYFNSLRTYINSLEDTAAIKSIVYGCEIPAEYQSVVYQTLVSGAAE